MEAVEIGKWAHLAMDRVEGASSSPQVVSRGQCQPVNLGSITIS